VPDKSNPYFQNQNPIQMSSFFLSCSYFSKWSGERSICSKIKVHFYFRRCELYCSFTRKVTQVKSLFIKWIYYFKAIISSFWTGSREVWISNIFCRIALVYASNPFHRNHLLGWGLVQRKTNHFWLAILFPRKNDMFII
jgi:hypothetical protein